MPSGPVKDPVVPPREPPPSVPPPGRSEPAVPLPGDRRLPVSVCVVDPTSATALEACCSSGAKGSLGAAGCEGREPEVGADPPECNPSVEGGSDDGFVLGLVTFGAEGTLTFGTVIVGAGFVVGVVTDPVDGREGGRDVFEVGRGGGWVGVVAVTPPIPGNVAVSAPA
jgi:hypothetical protein